MDFDKISLELRETILGELSVFVIVFASDEGDIIYYNNKAKKVFDRELCGINYLELFGSEHRIEGEGKERVNYECWVSGRCYMVEDFYTTTQQEATCRTVLGQDITDIKNYLLNYSNNSMTDQMTGSFNRQAGMDVLNEMINEGGLFSVVFLDLDNLKDINDTFGHIRGDDYITTVCNTIKECIRKSDILSRMGGDEFLIILPKCDEVNAERIMKDVETKLEDLNKKLQLNGLVYRVSYGISEVRSSNTLDMEQILHSADIKMYAMKNVKRAGRG